jgi:hypothetical protein
MSHDARLNRGRHEELATTVANLPEAPNGGFSFLGTTFALETYPTEPNKFFAVHPTDLSGTQEEGDEPTFSAHEDQVCFAYNKGTDVPPEGTRILCHGAGGRYVMDYNG